MKKKKEILSALFGLIIGGLAYWFQPYNESTVWGVSIWLIMSLGTFLASLFSIILLIEKPLKIAPFVSLGVIIAVFARIIYDTTFWDSTSHNLAPLEIIFASAVTVPCAFIGVYLGLFIKRQLN